MKNIIMALALIGFFSCSPSSRNNPEPFPIFLTPEAEWITYEGVLPSARGWDVQAELKLRPASPGYDSYYQLHGSIDHRKQPKDFFMSVHSRGKYTILYGGPDRVLIEINYQTFVGSVSRGRKIEQHDRVTETLLLKNNGDHELVVLDENMETVGPAYKLTRRSNLFTVEGYVTFSDDTADFFERNTRQTWPLSKLGEYHEADSLYKILAKEKFEGIYMKALGYSVHHVGNDGNEAEALVFKKILTMDSGDDLKRIN